MPRTFALGLLLLTSALALPRGASADIRTWNAVCTPGMLACISVTMRLEFDPDYEWFDAGAGVMRGGTRTFLTLSNLQGLPGFTEVGPSAFTNVDFLGLAMEQPTNATFDVISWDVGTIWLGTPVGNAWGRAQFERSSVFRGGGMGTVGWSASGPTAGLTGCDGETALGIFASTCGGAFDFDTARPVPGRVSFTDVTSLFIGGATGEGSCNTSIDCLAVPEPGTYLLMLSGLLGLGFVAWRRKGALA